MNSAFYQTPWLGKSTLNPRDAQIPPTTKATGNVQKQVGNLIPENFSETDSPHNQTPRWSDNCVTDLNGTVFMDNGIWDMIPCPNC